MNPAARLAVALQRSDAVMRWRAAWVAIRNADMFALYNCYTRGEIASLAGSAQEPLADAAAEFLLFSGRAVCIATASRNPRRTHFPLPTQFCWVPEVPCRLNLLDPVPWFPPKVRHALLTNSAKTHLFLRQDDIRCLYCGDMELASFGDEGPGFCSALFSLVPKLPHDLWRQVGLFTDWLLTVNGVSTCVDSESSFYRAIGEAKKSDALELVLTRYEEDHLMLLASGDTAVAYYSAKTIGKVTKSQKRIVESKEPLSFLLSNGELMYEAPDHIIRKEQAFQVLEAFYQSGKLPDLFAWESYI
jgi:hypothetical protein